MHCTIGKKAFRVAMRILQLAGWPQRLASQQGGSPRSSPRHTSGLGSNKNNTLL